MPARLLYLLVCCFYFSTPLAWGQKSCGMVPYQGLIKQQFPQMENEAQFEQWMSLKIREQSFATRSISTTGVAQIVIIPVVVHVVHNGEPVGSGTNITDSRILDQIQTLNEDFRRLNADTVNTPPQFQPVAADTEIEFVLAQRDPEGLPTNGIVRIQGTRSGWELVDNTELKSQSYWPAEDYMNIWVAPLNDLLGYAQFPVSTLEGLEIASQNRLTDGVVIDSDFFGNNPDSNPTSEGRTATHEVGHYLGLRHIWGDGGCEADDFCMDTPNSDRSHFGCPDSQSCGNEDMVENFMDLTSDQCMNLFTLCQKDRMQVVMANSPRRASLVNSTGALPPVMVDNDTGIRQVLFPQNSHCNSSFEPAVEVRNYGTNMVNSLEIQLWQDGMLVENRNETLTLDLLEIATITFSSISVPGMSEVSFLITNTNGVPDGNDENNTRSVEVMSESFAALPISESFASIPLEWEIWNQDSATTWEVVAAPDSDPGNTAAHINFYDYDNAVGEYDYLVTQALDLTTFEEINLEFSLSHAPFSFNSADGLIIAVSTDCGNTFPPSHHIYRKQGQELGTAPITSDPFVPSGKIDWRTETLSLDQYAGMDQVRIAFIGINDFGNNLYLDDVKIEGVFKPALDLAVTQIQQPGLVSCQNVASPQVSVKNTGINTVTTFQISYQLSNGATETITYSGPPLAAGQETSIAFNSVGLDTGPALISAHLDQVEGNNGDGDTSNDTLQKQFIVDTQRDQIPKIETFQASLDAIDWHFINPDNATGWQISAGGGLGEPGNQALSLPFFSYMERGAVDYAVTPVLDFSKATDPTLTFDLAYGGSPNFNDGMLVILSTDCGVNYTDTVFQAFGTELATVMQSTEFFPGDTADWKRQIIDLGSYAGQSDIRLAFAAVNDFGNNLYIDNVEFFLSDRINSLDLDLDQMIVFPNPARDEFEISFKLAKRESVALQIIDPLGRVAWSGQLDQVLNQTLTVQLPYSAGIYILQATSPSFRATRRIIMTR